MRYIGGGDSPVLAYDRYVVEHALEYLAQDHDRPQFITVGTYGPHLPYVRRRNCTITDYGKVDLSDVSGHL